MRDEQYNKPQSAKAPVYRTAQSTGGGRHGRGRELTLFG